MPAQQTQQKNIVYTFRNISLYDKFSQR